MKRRDFIGLEDDAIYGINNPMFIVSGTILKDDFTFELYIDGKKSDFEYLCDGNHFTITKTLATSDKIIELYLLLDNKKYLVTKRTNRKISRIKAKIVKTLKVIINKVKAVFAVLYKGIKFLWREHHFLVPPALWGKYFNDLKQKVKNYRVNDTYNPFIQKEYQAWLEKHEKETVYEDLSYQPLISVVIPVYNVSGELLSCCLDSVLAQKYDNFEICLADDCSTNKETIETLKTYEKKDKRVKVVYRKENGHISNASNSALEIASGEYIAMMDNDDVIPENALYEMVKALNEDKTIDMIYTDEDKLDLKGNRCDPNFKSDYAPDSLLSSNYFCHFTLLRTSIMRKIGGWRPGFEGAQDYDLFLRFTEQTDHIFHLPKILYHWRMVEGSTSMTIDNKSYALERGKKALEEALERRNINGIVHIHDKVPYYWIEYLYKKEPKISIIIPTRDYASTLDKCLKSVYEKTTYKNYEVIIANNNSEKKETFELFETYKKEHSNFKVIDINTEFNYSNINNIAVKKAKGEFILLLNNDTEVITENWLQLMIGYAMQPHVGAVGAKLIYPDKTIQHGGVILGIGGIAAHAFVNHSIDDVGMYGRLSVPYNYSAVTAACLMVEKKKYNEINGLTEELKVAFNDVDFNIRLLEKGYYNVFVPMAELYHFESKSRGLDTTSEKYKRFIKESEYMYSHWNQILKNDPFYNKNLSLKKGFMLDK